MVRRILFAAAITLAACSPKRRPAAPPPRLVVVVDTTVVTRADSVVVYRLDTIKETDTVRVEGKRAVITVTRREARCDVKPDTVRITKTVTIQKPADCPPPRECGRAFFGGVAIAFFLALILSRILR